MNMNSLAPVVLFVYNRPKHLQLTVEYLLRNHLAEESELIVYSDGARDELDDEKVRLVRSYLTKISGFKKIYIIKRERNYGLSDNIIKGISEVINEYKKIIVLEDDLITSPQFLKFMNLALNFYYHHKKVWHISGWNYPIEKSDLGDVFFWRGMNCNGWGTWQDRWKYYLKDPDEYINKFSKRDIRTFNLDGANNFFSQIIKNKKGKINTWAIFWYATIYSHDGLCVNPSVSYVKNIGFDGSGVNCGYNKYFETSLNIKQIINFDEKIEENKLAVKRIRRFYFSINNPIKKLLNKIYTLLYKD